MAFTQESSAVPTDIGALVILKTKPAINGDPAVQTAHYQVDVLDQDGNRIRQLKGNLVPHLTGGQISGLLDFMADLRVQAETEILP